LIIFLDFSTFILTQYRLTLTKLKSGVWLKKKKINPI